MNLSDNNGGTDKFTATLRLLGVLDDDSIARVVAESLALSVSPLAVLERHGSISPADVDVVALLMGEKEAIPGYQILELVGRGGMGVVFKARQQSLGRLVALKTVFASQADRTMISRFEQEAATIASLAHPNIVSALDFGRHQGNLYLAMEYVEGRDLGQLIDRQGKLPETTAIAIARQIAAGLAHASHAGIVHRDVKPANVLLIDAPEGYSVPAGVPMAKLTDFGLALLSSATTVNARLTSTHSALGSPHYMAPEQFEGKEIDSRADYFALGATLFHMLAGKPPWDGQSLNQIVVAKVQGNIPDIARFRSDLQPATRNMVNRLMSRKPSSRPSDYAALLDLLESGGGANRPFGSRKTPGGNEGLAKTQSIGDYKRMLPENRFRRRFFLAIVIVVVAVLAGLATMLMRPGKTVDAGNLVTGSNQVRLFDGVSMIAPGLRQRAGGWTTRDGRLVHVDGLWGIFQVNLPEWNNWAFETIVEGIDANIIEIQFGGRVTEENSPRFALRIAEGQATLGSLDDEEGTFVAISEPMPLDVTREAHFVSVSRKRQSWELSIDGMRPGTIPDGTGDHQHVLLVSRRKTDAPADGNTNAKFSELLVNQLVESGRN